MDRPRPGLSTDRRSKLAIAFSNRRARSRAFSSVVSGDIGKPFTTDKLGAAFLRFPPAPRAVRETDSTTSGGPSSRAKPFLKFERVHPRRLIEDLPATLTLQGSSIDRWAHVPRAHAEYR